MRTVFDGHFAMAYSRDGIIVLMAKGDMKHGVLVRLEDGNTEKLGPMTAGSTKQLKKRPIGAVPMSRAGARSFQSD